jgi:hypothetical protein
LNVDVRTESDDGLYILKLAYVPLFAIVEREKPYMPSAHFVLSAGG